MPSTGVGAAIAFVLTLVLAGPTAGQTTVGRIVGSVVDDSGAVLPGATVTLTNTGTAQTQGTVSGDTGTFVFPQVPAGTYSVSVTLEGFKGATFTDVIVAVGQDYPLVAKLAIGQVAETVTVEAGAALVATTTPEVSSTVLQRQVLEIPLANRDLTNLIKLQAGVQGLTNRANTVINGGRPTWTQVTLDGINIQDNFIRTNSVDFLPNRPTSDNVAEFSITSSVSGADSAGGATAVRMITPSGTNRFTGSAYEFNRDARFSANSFFNNASNVPKSDLSRHQFGGRVGGPIVRNRLFFFANYEGMRQTTQTSQNLTIPANADFSDGVFRYVALDNSVRSVNVAQLTGLGVDAALRAALLSQLPAASNVNNFTVGNSTAARLLNTAGYRFNQTDLNNRDSLTVRADYELTTQHRFEGVYSYFKETDDRTDLDVVSPDRPLVYTSSDPKRFALAWRYAGGSRFTHELRGGGNLAPVAFESDWDYGTGILYNTALNIVNPVGGFGTAVGFQPQGRFTNTYQIGSNGTLTAGRHDLQFGGSWQRNRVNPYNFANRYPVVSFGFSSAAPGSVQLQSSQFPGGISATDLGNANAMAAWIGGVYSSVTQTFQVRDATSGYVAGIPSDEKYTLDNVAAYVQDNWRWKPNFTVRAGLKWEYYSPLREDNNLGFLPVPDGRSFDQVMLDPTTRVGFVDGGYYRKDLNNFGPTLGFSWDVTSDGRTAVRGGYSLTFVNEESVTVGRSAARGNAGLSTGVTLSNLYGSVDDGVPIPAAPAFLTSRTLADQMALSASGVLWGIDPELRAPQAHQVSVGVQRELPWSSAIEARYVGTFGRDIWRGTDYNQLQISPAFLADFGRARANGFAAQAAGLPFNGAYNAAVPGSQPLTLLPSFGGGLFANTNVTNNLQTNQVAGLADFYVTSRVPGALATFMQNPGIYASQAIANGGFSDYNALQLELRRSFRNGVMGQVNYTLAASKTDSAGTAQSRFEAFMDNMRPGLSVGRSIFHNTHVVNTNAIVELPFGVDRRWVNGGGVFSHLLGDWQLGTIVTWQSGSPISLISGRASFNRAGRSNCTDAIGCNTAFSTLSEAEIRDRLGIFRREDKLYWIDPALIDPASGRAVGADNLANSAGFDGQVFFNPAASEVGNLQVMTFDGPAQFKVDLALSKRIRLTNRYRVEFKGEAFNLTNTPGFFIGDMNVNSVTFGQITSTNIGSRVVQLSARFDF